jgi:predicted nucleic acid-binding protein
LRRCTGHQCEFSLFAFFDTNILVYAAVGAGKDEHKRKRAVELIESTDFGIPAQVLQEFFVTVVKKASRPLSAAQALEWIEQWAVFPCQVSTIS